jgi:hypothetical protein
MKDHYPGYDVLNKRDTVSWDDITRKVIEERMDTSAAPAYLDPVAWRTVEALCDSLVPQPTHRPPVPVAAMLDAHLRANVGDGYRNARLPPLREAWRIGLAALNQESMSAFDKPYFALSAPQRHTLLERMQRGELTDAAWEGMPCDMFFANRVLKDICGAYYSHPYAWSEIGFGGPANPRGYVRMYFDRRDPWEAVEAKPGHEASARRDNRRVR